MKLSKALTYTIIVLGLFALIAQAYLIQENRTASVVETWIRFFSFFTILTNSLVVVYFISQSLSSTFAWLGFVRKIPLTAITAYILIVGLVYQIVLRPLWSPEGLQRWVDELLHSIIPILTLVFWWLNVTQKELRYTSILKWLAYPFFYLVYILIRGTFSGFYPYPFVDVSALGFMHVAINALLMLFFFVGVMLGLIRMGKNWAV
ncbi:MAG: Pr6Pr family membrane protein [Flavobacterium sp.]